MKTCTVENKPTEAAADYHAKGAFYHFGDELDCVCVLWGNQFGKTLSFWLW